MHPTREERIEFAKMVFKEAKDVGITQEEINEILSEEENKLTFLAVITEIARHSPNVVMAKKVIDKGESMRYAADIFGDWVYEATKNIETFKAALEEYLDLEIANETEGEEESNPVNPIIEEIRRVCST